MKNDLKKNTLLLAVGTIMTKGISFVMVPFFSRWLSIEDYGIFDLLCTYVTLLIPIISLATNEALFRFSMDVKKEEEKSYYITNCLVIFVLNTLVFSIIILAIKHIANWVIAPFFLLLSLGEICNMYLRGYLRALKRLDIYSVSNAISTLFIAFFTTLFVKGMGLQLQGILLGYAFGYIAGDIIIIIWTKLWRYIVLNKISFDGMKELIRYSYVLIPNNIAWWFINVSDRTIIKFFLGAASNGLYAIAYKIPNLLSAVFGVFSVSWQQSATEMLDSSDRDEYYNSVYNKSTIVLLSLCCGVLSLNSWFFNYIFDKDYYFGYLYAPILVSSTVFLTISQFFGGIQISLKQPKENGITTVTGAILNLIIHLCLIKLIGLYAAAVSTLISQIVVCVMRKIKLSKHVKLKYDYKTKIFFAVYVYFLIMSYFITNNVINVGNVVLATSVVIGVNWEFIKGILIKID